MDREWNAELYRCHTFVWQSASGLVELLAPRAGERVLDAGCGAGQLAAEIARSGALVTGVDASMAMLREARVNAPEAALVQADLTALPWRESFDGVFSNAVLHWVRDAGAAARAMAGTLKSGGRLVVEFGGKGNVAEVLRAAQAAFAEAVPGVPPPQPPWFYPSIGEYSAILEPSGLEVTYAHLFDRPTPLERGIDDWVRMFGGWLLGALGEAQREPFFDALRRHATPVLYRDGTWFADYRRLRIAAIKR